MQSSIVDATQQKTARITGVSYLIIIIAGILAEFFVRTSLIVPGDAAATASKILGSESLFRFSIAGDIVMVGADLVVAVALYVLLKPVNRHLALLAAFFRLVMDAVLSVNLLNLLAALMLVNGGGDLAVFGTDQLNAAALSFLDAHSLGYSIALIPFGMGTLLVGYLLYKSRYVPRAIAILMSLAAVVYLVGSSISILAPSLEGDFEMAYVIPLVAESALALWLTFKGIRPRIATRREMAAVAS